MIEKQKSSPRQIQRWILYCFIVLFLAVVIGFDALVNPPKAHIPEGFPLKVIDEVQFGENLLVITSNNPERETWGDTLWIVEPGEQPSMVDTNLQLADHEILVHSTEGLFVYPRPDSLLDNYVYNDMPLMVWQNGVVSQLTPQIDNLYARGDVYQFPVEWSPDGQLLLFKSSRDQWEETDDSHMGAYTINIFTREMTYISWRSRYVSNAFFIDNQRVYFEWWESGWGVQESIAMNNRPPESGTFIASDYTDRFSVINIANPSQSEITITEDILPAYVQGFSVISVISSSDGNHLALFTMEPHSLIVLDAHTMEVIEHTDLRIHALIWEVEWETYGAPMNLSLQNCHVWDTNMRTINFLNGAYDPTDFENALIAEYPAVDETEGRAYCSDTDWQNRRQHIEASNSQ